MIRFPFSEIARLTMVFFTILVFGCRCQAQGVENEVANRTVKVSSLAKSFLDVLKDINSGTKLNIMADGLSSQKVDGFEYSGSLKGLMDKIGTTFGYRWKFGSANTILLERKFSSATDLPQLIPEELSFVARQVLKLLPSVVPDNGDGPWGIQIIKLYDSLTDVQKAQLTNGAKLPFLDLNAIQRELITNTIDQRAYGTALTYWTYIESVFSRIQLSTLLEHPRNPNQQATQVGIAVDHITPIKLGPPVIVAIGRGRKEGR